MKASLSFAAFVLILTAACKPAPKAVDYRQRHAAGKTSGETSADEKQKQKQKEQENKSKADAEAGLALLKANCHSCHQPNSGAALNEKSAAKLPEKPKTHAAYKVEQFFQGSSLEQISAALRATP